MTTYTQYQLSNPPSQALDILTKLGQKYSFKSEFNVMYRVLTILTTDQSLITLIDSKAIPNLIKSTVIVPEYDDTKTISDVISMIENDEDTSNIRPELINQAQTKIAKPTK